MIDSLTNWLVGVNRLMGGVMLLVIASECIVCFYYIPYLPADRPHFLFLFHIFILLFEFVIPVSE